VSERWTIIQALSWLATGEALDLRQYIEKDEPDLDGGRVCKAALAGQIEVLGCPGVGSRDGIIHREFGHPTRIDPNAFVDASISFYGLSYLQNPRGLPVFYHLIVDRDKFARWANSAPKESIRSKVAKVNAATKKRGPKGTKTKEIIALMRVMDRAELEDMKGVQMEARFGASRSVCEDARKIALSETIAGN
jgi:hypothetical protein